MAGLRNSSPKYSIHVNDGRPKLSVGDHSRMSLRSRQKRRYSTSSLARATPNITGPEQKLKYIPPNALSEVVMHLNNYSPLGNNWRGIADEMCITFQAIRSLDHHGPGGMMDGVLEIMFHRKITVGQFVGMLQRIQRPDVIDILVKAGLQGDFFQEDETDCYYTATDANEYQTGKSGSPYNADKNGQAVAEPNVTTKLKSDASHMKNKIEQVTCQRTIIVEARNYGAAHEELTRARASSPTDLDGQ